MQVLFRFVLDKSLVSQCVCEVWSRKKKNYLYEDPQNLCFQGFSRLPDRSSADNRFVLRFCFAEHIAFTLNLVWLTSIDFWTIRQELALLVSCLVCLGVLFSFIADLDGFVASILALKLGLSFLFSGYSVFL